MRSTMSQPTIDARLPATVTAGALAVGTPRSPSRVACRPSEIAPVRHDNDRADRSGCKPTAHITARAKGTVADEIDEPRRRQLNKRPLDCFGRSSTKSVGCRDPITKLSNRSRSSPNACANCAPEVCPIGGSGHFDGLAEISQLAGRAAMGNQNAHGVFLTARHLGEIERGLPIGSSSGARR